MPLIETRKIVYAALEDTAGTAESPVNGDTAFYAMDAEYTPRPDLTPLMAAGSMSQYASQRGVEIAEVTFSVDLYEAAPWDAILLPACGLKAQTDTSEWKFVETTADWETLTVGFNRAGKRYGIRGAMGTYEMVFVAGKTTKVNFTFTGVAVPEADATQFTPAFNAASDTAGSRLVSATTTLNSTAICFSQATFTLGNTVEAIPCPNAAGGVERMWIAARETRFTMDPFEELVATRNDDAIYRAGTLHAFSMAYGNTLLTMPKLQLIQIAPGVRQGASARQLTYLPTINAAAGDEFVIDFDTTD